MNYNHANNPEAGAQVLIKAFSFFHEDTPEVPEYNGPQRMQQVNFVPQDLTKPNAMTAEYRFLQNHNVYTFGKNDIFVHNGSYYESMSKQQVAGMIADDCPDLLAQADNKRFLMSGVEGMFYNNALRIDSLTQSETLVPFMNCCIDTVACRFVQPDSNYFLSYRLNATYVFEGTCPNFDRFLADAMGGDLSLIERVWQMLGYNDYSRYQNRQLTFPYFINYLRFDHPEITKEWKAGNRKSDFLLSESVYRLIDYLYTDIENNTAGKKRGKTIYNMVHGKCKDPNREDYAHTLLKAG